ncbi:MAG TPA: phosphoribosylglycinamide formyltransferase [Spirochaetota bacterium]|nr:phosphoribosylglycinamide formyltransferase [Spirochaetota bacterium]HOD14034.1 phosphoribosylglycinamide formyltransferase [Spirochaetota bacterium]HPG49808.1 phosphoribosylglycinamide formyltransferase [Spirochaetota bacterium]HPN12726.1 phosphoribosylglycinamide formyltransferase [Spirochaetota bacterium]HQL81711.1 phosphoribosylglycinamide formyltransferase [Spirochaetota bacterium]
MKTRIAVLISGSGTNLQSIIDRSESGDLPAQVVCVISDREKAFGLERARKHGIRAFLVNPKDFAKREEHEEAIIRLLDDNRVELVVLAGYMRLLTRHMLERYRNRIINIHPALLPSFPGTDGYGDAWRYGVKVSGCTVHFVDEGCDSGPIILQGVNPVEEDDTFESFRERGLKLEHKVLPEAIRLYCEGRLRIEGRKVRILEKE